MYYGSKGWVRVWVKKLEINYNKERKLESYQTHVLKSLLLEKQWEEK